MEITLTATQEYTVTVQAFDAKGNPALLDGAVVFETNDPSKLAITPIDNISAKVSAVGPVGTAQLKATGDADLGEGVKSIFGILDNTIVASEAVNVVLTPGPVTEQGA